MEVDNGLDPQAIAEHLYFLEVAWSAIGHGRALQPWEHLSEAERAVKVKAVAQALSPVFDHWLGERAAIARLEARVQELEVEVAKAQAMAEVSRRMADLARVRAWSAGDAPGDDL